MNKILFVAAFLLCSIPSYSQVQPELTWLTDIAQAHTLSVSTQKPVFAFFTGSDWCGWCHKLQREVFAKPDFISWANDNVVLLELDFPKKKQLPDNLVQQNQGLQQFFGVGGYPTIWIFTITQDEASKKFAITPLGSLGYPSGATPGKEEVKFLETANVILAKKRN